MRPTWKELLSGPEPLLLPAAHDALTARLIERAGFRALQCGGFAIDGANFALPDIDLTHYGEKSEVVRRIIDATLLPVLVDADDGYGDVKNVYRTVRGYEAMGAAAIFINDQQSPTSCGQEGNKKVVPIEVMVGKIKAACAARRDTETFIIARTDARGSRGLVAATERAVAFASLADGVYVEGLENARELEHVGWALKGIPLAMTMMEGGGKLPWLSPCEIAECGFSMILYPTTVLFRAASAIQAALLGLRVGHRMDHERSINLFEYDQVVGRAEWDEIEAKFGGS